MSSPEDNAKTVNRYLELAAQGKVDDIVELYAVDGTVELGGNRVSIEIISTMTFNDDGKIASMKAYWGPENIKPA